ncbi:MAG TPA: hypothetical protein VF428_03700 [Casimicrobiaceae bacterium]|jgi:xanthine/uracil permease
MAFKWRQAARNNAEATLSKWFWARRFVIGFAVAAVILFAVHAIKGYALQDSVVFGALWGAIAAAVFTVTGYIKYKRNPTCMLRQGKLQ